MEAWRKRGQEIGRRIIILNPEPLWKDLEKLRIIDFAEKYGATRCALTVKLRAMNPSRYEEIMARRRILRKVTSTQISEETWRQLENGSSVRGIAAQQHIHRSILDRKLWQNPRYFEIINQRRRNREGRILEAAKQFEEGQLLGDLSKDLRIGIARLRSRIQGIIGSKTYFEILRQRRNNPSNKITTSTIKAAATLLIQGSKVIDICRQFRIHRKTLRRRLRQTLGNKYDQIIQQRRTPEQLIQKLARLFLNGESLNQLSKDYNVPLQTLHRRLIKEIGLEKYKDTIEERLLHTTPGTRGASRSKYELNRKPA